MIEIKNGADYLPQIRELIIEYTNSLGRDLSFQDLSGELADIAAKYTPPAGELIAAAEEGRVLGMAAYHRHSDSRCEMKRLYVRPEARGRHLGELLVSEIVSRAAAAGYKEMVLDTIEPLKAAVSLYRKMGFVTCEPYYHNPMPDVIYMSKSLG